MTDDVTRAYEAWAQNFHPDERRGLFVWQAAIEWVRRNDKARYISMYEAAIGKIYNPVTQLFDEPEENLGVRRGWHRDCPGGEQG